MYDLRMKELDGYEIVKRLERKIELTEYQKQVMRSSDFWRGFKVMVHKDPERAKPLWRATILFYWAFILFVILFVFPVKWMITGTRSCKESEWHYKIYRYWSKKLNLY